MSLFVTGKRMRVDNGRLHKDPEGEGACKGTDAQLSNSLEIVD